jgi:hypothetical protein
VITGECNVGPEDLGAGDERDDGQDVEETILAALADGKRPSREIKQAVTAEIGCSRQTVERAAKRLAERGELVVESGGFPRRTTWALTVASGSSEAAEATGREATGETGIPEPNQGTPAPQSPHVPSGEATGSTYAPKCSCHRPADLADDGRCTRCWGRP